MALTPDALEAQQARVYRVLVANAKDELRKILDRINLANPEAARNALLEIMPALADKYGDAAASAAAEWYDALRIADGVPGRFTPTAIRADAEAVVQGTRRASGLLWDGNDSQLAVSLESILDLNIKRAGRDTLTQASIQDPFSAGWARRTVGATCLFCQMLATRGAVYKKATASFASHHDCDCVAIPSFDPDAPEVKVRQYEASQRTSRMSPEQKAAHNERVASWLEDFAREG